MTGKKDDDGDDWRKWDEDELIRRAKERLETKGGKESVRSGYDEAIAWMPRILHRLARMSKEMRLHYRGEVFAIARDLARDIDLDCRDDSQLKMVIQCLMMNLDDDDDDEGEKPDLPKLGDLVNA